MANAKAAGYWTAHPRQPAVPSGGLVPAMARGHNHHRCPTEPHNPNTVSSVMYMIMSCLQNPIKLLSVQVAWALWAPS